MNASLTDAEQQVWRSVLIVADLLRFRVAADVKPASGLSSADHSVLMRLNEAPDKRLGQQRLADDMFWSKSRLSHQLTRMEQRGLVARGTAPGGRGVEISLTDAGHEAVDAMEAAHAEAVRRHLFRVASEAELTVIVQLAERLKAREG
ncbi:MarR family winged helix-turn-helix transcriptional regulator [Streptomyces sp. NPDC091377]|uniref:MarR family winged helix-turn-helix transcriptional regulator n=1 Tax=Streptomyces sp. NPDC091377 TaxID=3365995 RepID=UPI003810B8F1